MIDDLVRQLQDPDPGVRGRAILALGKSKDASALKALAQIVQHDPDAEVRELARKAGRYIRQQAKGQTRAQNGTPPGKPTTQSQAKSSAKSAVEVPPAPTQPTRASRYKLLDDRPSDTELSVEAFDYQEAALPEPSLEQLEDLELDALLPDPDFVINLPEPTPVSAPPAPVEPPTPTIVRGREYNVSKDAKIRAKQYLDSALSFNMRGDNAKAMKDLTEAISLNPNLINDTYFNSVATTITELNGDAATQMIIDRNERRRFTQQAVRVQKTRRVEEHLTEAESASWDDVWFEVILYSLIAIFGPLIAVLVTSESVKNLLANYAAVSRDLPDAIKTGRISLTGLSVGTLLPLGIVAGISGVVSLLLQTVLIHYSAKAIGGTGTWRHLVRVLLGFYNKWLPFLFIVLYLTVAIAFISAFSPIALCFVIILVGFTLYISSKTSGKVGEAYDFGAAKGCMALIFSLLVIGLINAVIGFLMVQALGLAFSQIAG